MRISGQFSGILCSVAFISSVFKGKMVKFVVVVALALLSTAAAQNALSPSYGPPRPVQQQPQPQRPLPPIQGDAGVNLGIQTGFPQQPQPVQPPAPQRPAPQRPAPQRPFQQPQPQPQQPQPQQPILRPQPQQPILRPQPQQDAPADEHDHDHDHVGLDWLRDSVPGEPGQDYPIFSFNAIPETGFSCAGRVNGGFYADVQAQCQVFHVCTDDAQGGLTRVDFLCPNGTIYNQEAFVCDWWFNVDCNSAEGFFNKNDEIGKVPEGAQQFQQQVPVQRPIQPAPQRPLAPVPAPIAPQQDFIPTGPASLPEQPQQSFQPAAPAPQQQYVQPQQPAPRPVPAPRPQPQQPRPQPVRPAPAPRPQQQQPVRPAPQRPQQQQQVRPAPQRPQQQPRPTPARPAPTQAPTQPPRPAADYGVPPPQAFGDKVQGYY